MRAVLVLLAVLAFAAGCGSDDGAESATDTTTSTTASSAECESVDAPEPRDPEAREAPTEQLDSATSYSLVFDTSCGSFTVALDQELAPNTAASLVALAEAGFYDDTIIHRVASGFVIQGGDPTQTGAGGPGYSTVDVPPENATYPKGTMAMAKTQDEPSGTAGSQFFVMSGDSGLDPAYAIVGEVSEGIETVEQIDALGVGDGPPSQPVVVDSVTVATS